MKKMIYILTFAKSRTKNGLTIVKTIKCQEPF